MSDSRKDQVRQGAPRPRLLPHSWLMMVERVLAEQSPSAVAAQMGSSLQRMHKWVDRYETEGATSLEDCSSRPRRSPVRRRYFQAHGDGRATPRPRSGGGRGTGWTRLASRRTP